MTRGWILSSSWKLAIHFPPSLFAGFQEEERIQIDDTWLELLDMLIGDAGVGPNNFITGAEACARKKSDKVELWMRNMNMESVLKVGRMFKERVKVGDSNCVQLSMHTEEKDGDKGLKLKLLNLLL